jgi:hypothetical protein
MNPSSTAPSDTNQVSGKLPPLHTATLDLSQVEHLLADIEACTTHLEILPKFAAQGRVPEVASVSLQTAREMLAQRRVRGLQLRYHYDGADWWDTLMVTGNLFRIVRIRHEFDAPGTS